MKKNFYDCPFPTSDEWGSAATTVVRAVSFFGKKISPETVRLELNRRGEYADGIICVLNRYDISAESVSLTSDGLKTATPCIIETKEGFLFLAESKNERFVIIDGEGKKTLPREKLDSVYLGKAIKLKPAEGFNLAEEQPFDTIRTFSETAKNDKLRLFTLSFAYMSALIFTVIIAGVIKAYLTERVFGIEGVRLGATWLFVLSFAMLVLSFAVAFFLRKAVSRSLSSVICDVAEYHADRTDPVLYSSESKEKRLARFGRSAEDCAYLYTGRIYTIWCVLASAVFCALGFMIDALCAIPVAVAFLAFAVSFVIGAFFGRTKLALLITSLSSYVAVCAVICVSAFAMQSGLTPANAVVLVIYALLHAFTSVSAVKGLFASEKMRVLAFETDAFLNTDVYSGDNAVNDDYTIKFEKATVLSGGRTLEGNLDFTIPQGKVTSVTGGNTQAVLKACAGVCFDVTGKRTIGGAPYSEAGRKIVSDTVFTENCGIRRGSVFENIRDFNANVPSSEVYGAARKLGLTDTVMKSLGSFEFLMAEGGKNVSGTICAGVMLARLFIKKPKLAFISKEALPSGKEEVGKMLKVLAENGITVVTDKALDADNNIDLGAMKKGGKRNG